MSNPGARNDLKAVTDKLRAGQSLTQIARSGEHDSTIVRNAGGLYKFARCFTHSPDERPVKVSLYIGTTGAGKTHAAVFEARDAGKEYFLKTLEGWWDGYCGEKYVIFDDFAGRSSKTSLDECLHMLDKWRHRVNNKGASEELMDEEIVITTNIHPINWYKYDGRWEHYRALARRFHSGCVKIFRERGQLL